jgi:SAM-dependent methyltransferase
MTDIDTFRCLVCDHSDLNLVERYANLPRVTSDAKPFSAGGRLYVCRGCGAIQKTPNMKWLAEIREIYKRYTLFELSDGAEQLIYTDLGPVPRSHRLVDFLVAEAGLPTVGNLLDVGCGTGAALANLSQALPAWSLYGTELSERCLPALLAIPNFKQLFVCRLSEVPLSFDLITMIHFLEHATDPFLALKEARELATATGAVFIQVPDVESSPFDLAIADHLIHFTLPTLELLARRAGLTISSLTDDVLPKELTMLGRAGRPTQGNSKYDEGWSTASRAVNWLVSVLEAATNLAFDQPIGLFGTSIASMWLFGAIKDRVAFFVDEDPTRIGRSHEGRPILHPRSVAADSVIFVALVPHVADAIVQRYENGPGRFVAPPHPSASFRIKTSRPSILNPGTGC